MGSFASGASSDLFRRTGPRHTYAFPTEIVVDEEQAAADESAHGGAAAPPAARIERATTSDHTSMSPWV